MGVYWFWIIVEIDEEELSDYDDREEGVEWDLNFNIMDDALINTVNSYLSSNYE